MLENTHGTNQPILDTSNRVARPNKMAISRFLYASAALLSLFSGRARADENGETSDDSPLCACSPSRFTFTLDFSLDCPPVGVTRNPGIAATFCQISPFGSEDQNIQNKTPVEVDYIDVLELGQTFQVLSQQNISDVSMDGDSFTYDSILLNSEIPEVPKVIQLNIFARNPFGEPIVNFFAISFSNNCSTYPTMIEGDTAGWTQFVSQISVPNGSSQTAAADLLACGESFQLDQKYHSLSPHFLIQTLF